MVSLLWPWPWIGSYCIPSCITHRHLPTNQISLKSKKLFYGRTDGHLRPTLLNRLGGVDLKMNKNWTCDCGLFIFYVKKTCVRGTFCSSRWTRKAARRWEECSWKDWRFSCEIRMRPSGPPSRPAASPWTPRWTRSQISRPAAARTPRRHLRTTSYWVITGPPTHSVGEPD